MEAQENTSSSNGIVPKTLADLKALGTSDLRCLVRDLIKQQGDKRIAPSVVVGMRKEECLEYLLENKVPMMPHIDMDKPVTFTPREPKTMTIQGDKDAASLLRQAIEALGIEAKSKPQVDIDTLKALVKEEVLRSVKPIETHIHLKTATDTKVITTCQHRLFPLLLKMLEIQGLNLCLTGPTGSGKTRCIMNAAKALNIPCFLMPMNLMTTKSDLAGYMDATGKYVESPLFRAAKNGGIILFDEFDCSNAGMATWLNAALANRCVTFPNGETIDFHGNFKPVVCMNTTGYGATMQYVGRNALDAATLDRFVMVDYGYDEVLERQIAIAGHKEAQTYVEIDKGGLCSNAEMVAFIQQFRKDLAANQSKAIVSPRASINACLMLNAGIGLHWILNSVCFKGVPQSDIAKSVTSAKLNGHYVTTISK